MLSQNLNQQEQQQQLPSVMDIDDDYLSSHTDNEPDLEHLLSIWPILSTIASHTPAGDLISLSRASSTCRAITHNLSIHTTSNSSTSSNNHPHSSLHIGDHQTPYWTTLKSLAPFTCSSPSHKDPKISIQSASSPTPTSPRTTKSTIRPCKHCSLPICKTCIVRSFFADPTASKQTFRSRTRYLCQGCWDTGNLRRDFRYPVENISREHLWRGQSYGQRGGRCTCSASEDNWLCGRCRGMQNVSALGNGTVGEAGRERYLKVKGMVGRNGILKGEDVERQVRCYGLDCDVLINEENRDRRRICLWCSKSLARQYGGEERLRWEEKQLEIRAAMAAARSADIGEWARNRFRTLTMSRREMRGTEECVNLTGKDGPEHDTPIFVKHLDAVNYRQWVSESVAPSPDCVYQSKHGQWKYSRKFLLSFNSFSRGHDRLRPPEMIDAGTLHGTTKENGLRISRRNMDFVHMPRTYPGCKDGPRGAIYRLLSQFQEAGIMEDIPPEDLQDYWKISWSSLSRLKTLRDRLYEQLETWENMTEEERMTFKPVQYSVLLAESGGKTSKGDRTLIPWDGVTRNDEPVRDEGMHDRPERPSYVDREESPPPV